MNLDEMQEQLQKLDNLIKALDYRLSQENPLDASARCKLRDALAAKELLVEEIKQQSE